MLLEWIDSKIVASPAPNIAREDAARMAFSFLCVAVTFICLQEKVLTITYSQ